MLELVDTHVHLDAEDYRPDLPELLDRARQAGVTRFVTIGAGMGVGSANAAINLAETHSDIWCSVGLHPHDAKVPVMRDQFKDLLQHPRVVAIGETGLDFFKEFAPRDLQEQWFRYQIELAHEFKKPLIIHSREAGSECLKILEEMDAKQVRGVFHCYSEDGEFAKRLAQINFLVSVPGSVTFKKADKLRAAMEAIPLNQIMLETDGPFLAPEPHRGKRCESAFMVETAKALAKVKGLTLEEVAQTTTSTAVKFFNLA